MYVEKMKGLGSFFFFLIPGVEVIDKGKDFCYHLIDCGGNFLSEINLGKNLNQIGIILDRNIPFLGQCDNLFSNKPLPLCSHDGGILLRRLVLYGNCFFNIFCFLFAHLFRPQYQLIAFQGEKTLQGEQFFPYRVLLPYRTVFQPCNPDHSISERVPADFAPQTRQFLYCQPG